MHGRAEVDAESGIGQGQQEKVKRIRRSFLAAINPQEGDLDQGPFSRGINRSNEDVLDTYIARIYKNVELNEFERWHKIRPFWRKKDP